MSSSVDRNLYRVLGLTPTATDGEIRSAYLQLARVLHPDRYGGSSEAERRLAERRMREVNGAWEVLGRLDKRKVYDAELKYQMMSHEWPPQVREHFVAGHRETGPADADDLDFDRDPFEGREEDMILVPSYQAFLLRRVPVIVAIALAVAIFVGTAYASSRPSAPTTPTTVLCNSALRGGCDTQPGG